MVGLKDAGLRENQARLMAEPAKARRVELANGIKRITDIAESVPLSGKVTISLISEREKRCRHVLFRLGSRPTAVDGGRPTADPARYRLWASVFSPPGCHWPRHDKYSAPRAVADLRAAWRRPGHSAGHK